MSARWSARFSGDGSDVLLESNIDKVVNRMKNIINQYHKADISTLRKLQKAEFALNSTYRTGWETAKTEFVTKRKNKSLTAIQQPQYPDEYHIVLICYSLEWPKVYEEFNRQTRNVKQPTDLQQYHYKSFFIFLLKSIEEMYGEPMVHPGVLYRGCSMKFANAKPGKYIIFQQFTSTSSREDVAKAFASSHGTLFEFRGYIRNSTGMDHHSIYGGEKEYVVWPFEYFEILQVKSEGGFTRIILEA